MLRLEGNWEEQEGRETREQQTAGYFKTTQAMHIGRFSLLACTHLAASEYAPDLFRLDGENGKGARGERHRTDLSRQQSIFSWTSHAHKSATQVLLFKSSTSPP